MKTRTLVCFVVFVILSTVCLQAQAQMRTRPRLDPRAATDELKLRWRSVQKKSAEEIKSISPNIHQAGSATSAAAAMIELPSQEIAPTVLPTTPQIFCPTKEIDWGTLFLREKWKGSFIIQNIGKDDLRIQDIKKECGCTGAEVTSKVVPPGATTELKVLFSGYDHPTKVNKKVTVLTNDPAKPKSVFKIVGSVTSAFLMEPARLPHFGQMPRGATAERSMIIRQILDKPIEITKVESTSPLVAVDFITMATKPLPIYQLKATVTVPDDYAERLVKSDIRIHTDFPRQQTISFTTIAPIQPDLEVQPPFLNFHSMRPGQEASRIVNLRSRSGKNFHILKIDHQVSDFEIEAVTEEEGLHYKIVAKIGDDFDRKGYFRENITIETDMPGYEKVPIILYGSTLPTWGARSVKGKVRSATAEKGK